MLKHGEKVPAAQKRILVVSQHFWPENFRINDIVDFLIEKGHKVDVLCGLPNYPKGEFFTGYSYFSKRHEIHNDARIDRVLEIKRGNNSNIRIFLNYVSFPFFSLFHIPKLLTRKYDVVLIYQLSPVMMSIAGLIVGRLKNIPVVTYVLDLWPENLFSVLPVKNPILKRIATSHSHWYYRRSDKLIALSEKMRFRLHKITGNSKIAVVPQAAEKLYEEKKISSELRKRFKDSFNVVFTGNISPAQDPETMIEAAKILKDRGLSDIKWLIVGDGMSRNDMEASVNSHNLADTFIFEGIKPMTDMPKYGDIANVLVGCLTNSDLLEATIPAKIMSYVAMAKPIVLAMDGEVQNLINDTINCGFAGPTENAATLADNIEKVYRLSKSERDKLGKNAKAYHQIHLQRDVLLGKINDMLIASADGESR